MKNDGEQFYFDRKNYFLRLKQQDVDRLGSTSRHVRHALDYFLDDLNRNREKTIERFLSEPGLDDIFLTIAQLLSSNDER